MQAKSMKMQLVLLILLSTLLLRVEAALSSPMILKATPSEEGLKYEQYSGWTLSFEDNGDCLFEISELKSYSGWWLAQYEDPFEYLLNVPDIPGYTIQSSLDSLVVDPITDDRFRSILWYTAQHPNLFGFGHDGISCGTGFWTYEIGKTHSVPEPETCVLLLSCVSMLFLIKLKRSAVMRR